MYHQRHFKLLIHRQSVDLAGRKRICWQDLCCTPDKTVSERLLLNNTGLLLEFFGIYFVTSRWKCLLDRLFRSCLRFLNDGKFRFQEPFIKFWEIKLKGEADTASDVFRGPEKSIGFSLILECINSPNVFLPVEDQCVSEDKSQKRSFFVRDARQPDGHSAQSLA